MIYWQFAKIKQRDLDLILKKNPWPVIQVNSFLPVFKNAHLDLWYRITVKRV